MYLDSCILVKLLAAEPDTEFFQQALEGQPVVTSELALTEVFSALLARERAGHLTVADRKRAWRELEGRVKNGEIQVEPLNSLVLRKARHHLEHGHPQVALRTLDAIHLATADLCHDFPLVSTDHCLRQAALAAGYEVFPPADENPDLSH